MSDSISDLLLSLFNLNLFTRIRRNHGLEHATLHVLAKNQPGRSLAGHSNPSGFWILGEVSTPEIKTAVIEALRRMQNGERSLAVHPNCGTNFATSGILAGGAASLAMFGAGKRWTEKLERIPLAMTLATLALIVSHPLGLRLQERVTTSGDLDGMEILEIRMTKRSGVTAHRIITSG